MTAGMVRVTFQNALDCKIRSFKGAIFLDRFKTVMRARRVEAAAIP